MKPASPSIGKRRQAAVDPVRKVMRQTTMEPGHTGASLRAGEVAQADPHVTRSGVEPCR